MNRENERPAFDLAEQAPPMQRNKSPRKAARPTLPLLECQVQVRVQTTSLDQVPLTLELNKCFFQNSRCPRNELKGERE